MTHTTATEVRLLQREHARALERQSRALAPVFEAIGKRWAEVFRQRVVHGETGDGK